MTGKVVGNRTIETLEAPDPKQCNACDLIYVSGDSQLIKSACTNPPQNGVLTVGDENSENESDCIISFYSQGAKVHFTVNMDLAQKAGVRFSSKLLQFAKIIYKESP
jgi:hypothetical protein